MIFCDEDSFKTFVEEHPYFRLQYNTGRTYLVHSTGYLGSGWIACRALLEEPFDLTRWIHGLEPYSKARFYSFPGDMVCNPITKNQFECLWNLAIAK